MTRRRGRRRRSFKEWVNSPRVSGWISVTVAAGCLVVAVGSYEDATALRDHGIRTRATVIEVNGGKSPSVIVRFTTTAGQHVTAEVENYKFQPKPRLGDEPHVIYDPDDPDGNVSDVRMGPDFFTPWATGIGAVVAAIVAWATFTRRIDWSRWA